MILISLLIALGIERVAATTPYWQWSFYFSRYLTVLQNQVPDYQEKANDWKIGAWLIAPSLIVYFMIQLADNLLIEFVLSTLILVVCVGCREKRNCYKSFLQAANRGDTEACVLHSESLGYQCDDTEETVGTALMWINYSHYFAVVFWYVLLGPAASLGYVVLREFVCHSQAPDKDIFVKALGLIDWVPARLTAFGYLIVGHFTRALPVWLGFLFESPQANRKLLSTVGKAAEDVETGDDDCTEEPCTMVKLAKRNLIFFLSAVSIMTLYGWVQ